MGDQLVRTIKLSGSEKITIGAPHRFCYLV
jgi:hypothetical protein